MFNHKQRATSNAWNMALLGLVAMASAAIVMVVSRSDIFGKRGNDLPGSFVFDANKFRAVDPALVTHRELIESRIDTGMKTPRGIALADDGRILVAGDCEVKVFSADGKAGRSFSVGGQARCLAPDANAIYVGVDDHVETYDFQGQKQASWTAPAPGGVITCVTVFEDGVFAACYHRKSGRVVRYNRRGEQLNEIVSRDDANAPEPFTTPSEHLDVVAGPDGLLRIANPGKLRVEAYTPEGQPCLRLNWGAAATTLARPIEGFMPCCNPTDLAMLADGSFVTAEKGVPRVKTYDASGRFTGVVATPEDFAPNAAGLDLAADKAGRIYVLDPDARAVRVFAARTK